MPVLQTCTQNIYSIIRSVSDKIWKAPLAEARTALRKQKIRYVNSRYLPITEILWKLLPHTECHWNGQSAVRHLEFKKSYLVTWLSSSSKCAVVYQILSKSERYGNVTIFSMAAIRRLYILNFRNYVTWPLSLCYSALLRKISLKSNNRVLSDGQ